MKLTITLSVEVNGEELLVLVTGTISPLVRGRTHGLPENCYPDEGGEVEIEEATVDGKPYELTKEQEERAEEMLAMAAGEEDEYPDSDPYIQDCEDE